LAREKKYGGKVAFVDMSGKQQLVIVAIMEGIALFVKGVMASMIDKEKEYSKVFKLLKRWAKHWLTNSAHRAHSSTIGLRVPSENTLDFINLLDNEKITYKDKVQKLHDFCSEQNKKEQSQKLMGTGYYLDCLKFIESKVKSIESGEPVSIPKMLKS
jgi:hypothetical protein